MALHLNSLKATARKMAEAGTSGNGRFFGGVDDEGRSNAERVADLLRSEHGLLAKVDRDPMDVGFVVRVVGCSEAAHASLESAEPVTTDGPLGHGWACSRCGEFLQAG